MKKINTALISAIICFELLFSGCQAPKGHPPLNPYMEDRTQGWTTVMICPQVMSLINFGNPSYTDEWILLLRETTDQPSFHTTITSKSDAADAMRNIVWNQYGILFHNAKIHVALSINEQYWIVQFIPYYAIFDLSGELVAFVNTDTCDYLWPEEQYPGWKSMIESENRFNLVYSYNLAELTVAQMVEYSKANFGETRFWTKYLGNYFITESATVEQAYKNAVEISEKEFSRYKFDDKFCVYVNHADDAWIVCSSIFVAAFSKETGELVYIERRKTEDVSYKTGHA